MVAPIVSPDLLAKGPFSRAAVVALTVMDSSTVAHMFDLTGRTAIVTGGSRGIGLAIAKSFAGQGANVVVASRKADACHGAKVEIESAGGIAIAVPTHMGDLDQVEALAAATVDAYGGIDIVVNNAANPLALPIGKITPEAWAKSFDVNLRGPVFLFQAALEHLLASDHASVINVISVGAFLFTPYQSMYGAGKNALLHFTRSMSAEYASKGIRVNALAPGTIDTVMTRNTGEEAFARMSEVSQMGRIGEPEEMVGAALLLASDAGSYITGQAITVDGGFIPPR